jgi:hypothetical protein
VKKGTAVAVLQPVQQTTSLMSNMNRHDSANSVSKAGVDCCSPVLVAAVVNNSLCRYRWFQINEEVGTDNRRFGRRTPTSWQSVSRWFFTNTAACRDSREGRLPACTAALKLNASNGTAPFSPGALTYWHTGAPGASIPSQHRLPRSEC